MHSMTKTHASDGRISHLLPHGSARVTLLNALGELAYLQDEPVPTTSLTQVLGEVGHGGHAARQAVSRCARAGWITGHREGRTSRWSLTDAGRDLVEDGIRRVEELGVEFSEWDGRWFVLVISIPQERRSIRDRLYRTLQWEGFGSPIPGIWVTPHCDRYERIAAAVDRLDLGGSTVSFFGAANGIGLSDSDLVGRSWDLGAVAQTYADLVRRFSDVEPRTDADALRTLLALDEHLRWLPGADPCLPEALTPSWPGRRDAARLLKLRNEWLKPARRHWQGMLS